MRAVDFIIGQAEALQVDETCITDEVQNVAVDV